MSVELIVKGIVLSTYPQGEYGKRLSLITDKLGKITAFASGAARAGSKIIGLARPLTVAEFTLRRGKSAWNLREAKLIDAFSELPADFTVCFYAFYVLEVSEYFSVEGMPEEELKELLNLIYVTLEALRQSITQELVATKTLSSEIIRRVFELRILKIEGEYTLGPATEDDEDVKRLWTYILSAPLSKLYKNTSLINREVCERFIREEDRLFKRQVPKTFNSEKLLWKS